MFGPFIWRAVIAEEHRTAGVLFSPLFRTVRNANVGSAVVLYRAFSFFLSLKNPLVFIGSWDNDVLYHSVKVPLNTLSSVEFPMTSFVGNNLFESIGKRASFRPAYTTASPVPLFRTQSVGSAFSSCAAARCKRLNPALCKLCTETPSPAILSAAVATQARIFSRNRWLNMTEGKWESEVGDASRHSQITSRMHQISLILHLAPVISLA